MPGDLYRALIQELAAVAGEFSSHPTYRKLQIGLINRYQESVRKRIRRERNHAAPPPPDSLPAHGFLTDAYCAGRVGDVDLTGSGCFSFCEACTLAARVIAENGLTAHVTDVLKSGTTVRELLRSMFGVTSESRPPHGSTDATERRAFLRAIRRVRSSPKTAFCRRAFEN